MRHNSLRTINTSYYQWRRQLWDTRARAPSPTSNYSYFQRIMHFSFVRFPIPSIAFSGGQFWSAA